MGGVTPARDSLGNFAWLAAVLFVVTVQPLYLLPIEQQLPITLMLVMVGLFLKRPTVRADRPTWLRWPGNALDLLLIAAAISVGLYVTLNYKAIIFRQGAFTPLDLWVSLAGLFLTLESVRRSVGWPLTIVCLVFVFYALYGRIMPGALLHRGYSIDRIAQQVTLSYSGIYGIPLAVMVRYVILFIVFGVLLQMSGAADFLVRFAQTIAGRFTGGLGKVAVVASGLVGSISGSAAGNVATTGSVTIPAMKRSGYQPHMAGAIESVASTGGQIMPPIMGAAAFLLADYLSIPYIRVVTAAIIPALFYYLSAGIAIDLYARARGIRGLPREQIPRFWPTMKAGWYYIAVIALVYGLLIRGFSPTRAAFVGIVAAAVLALIKRAGFRASLGVLLEGAQAAAILSAVTAGAGIVVGVVQLTGLGAQLASAMVDIALGNVLILLVLVMVASIILGMGMPTTVVYVLLAALVAPALIEMGIRPLAAHFFFFYYGVLAAITPPVALASYAAASIAGSSFDKTGWAAFQMALPAFIVPFFFVLNPALLLDGTTGEIVHSTLTAALGIWLFTTAVMNYLNGRMPWWLRLVMLGGSLMLIHGGWTTDGIGLAILTGALLLRFKASKPVATDPIATSSTTSNEEATTINAE